MKDKGGGVGTGGKGCAGTLSPSSISGIMFTTSISGCTNSKFTWEVNEG